MIFVGDDELAGGMQRRERRVLLDGELVERQMLGGFRDGALELDGPGLRRLPRPRIDEVEGIALEHRARDRDRVERLARRVQASELLERRIVERLHAERHAVDAGGAVAAEALGLDAGGIGLERHLGAGRDGPVLRDGVEQRAHGRRLHQRRRAAAEEDGGDGAARRALGGGGDLGREGAHVARLVDGGVAHVAVEIAIGTLRQAERPMHIDAERRCVSLPRLRGRRGGAIVSAAQDRPPPA